MHKPPTLTLMQISLKSASEGGRPRCAQLSRLSCMTALAAALSACDGAPSRNILGSYFPSWMVCALAGLAVALLARAIFKSLGVLAEIPVPLIVMAAIGCAGTFAIWLVWLS
jgi:hypothetical protein